jgi:hypothetical protein
MRELTSCADNLVLFGEMLEAASDYISRCEETLGHEETFMVELAHGQLYFLRKRLAKLDHRLGDLDVQCTLTLWLQKGNSEIESR